jgi:hypothetical protein
MAPLVPLRRCARRGARAAAALASLGLGTAGCAGWLQTAPAPSASHEPPSAPAPSTPEPAAVAPAERARPSGVSAGPARPAPSRPTARPVAAAASAPAALRLDAAPRSADPLAPPASLAAVDASAETRAEAPEPETPAYPWLDAGRPARVLLVGDSMIATDFGRELEAYLSAHADVVTHRRGRSSSGLARPDYFDWFELGAALAKRFRPDVVVVVIGGNDGQDLRPKAEGRWIHWRSDRWADGYRARTHRFLDAMAAPGRRFAWIELPAMAHRRLEGKLETIRAVQAEALAERDDVLAEIPGAPCFYDADRLLRTVPDGPDAGAPMRLDDGIHFTVAGARHYAACVGPVLQDFLPPKPPSEDAS